jgi:undecaprenyl diphosphate synthase
MDGNGRWALAHGDCRAPPGTGGATAVRRTIEAAPSLGITALTLYAFSADNWQRPRAEVQSLLRLLQVVPAGRDGALRGEWRAAGGDRPS